MRDGTRNKEGLDLGQNLIAVRHPTGAASSSTRAFYILQEECSFMLFSINYSATFVLVNRKGRGWRTEPLVCVEVDGGRKIASDSIYIVLPLQDKIMNCSKNIKPGFIRSRLDFRSNKEGNIFFLTVLHSNMKSDFS